jgi:methionyl aminopeptidase
MSISSEQDLKGMQNAGRVAAKALDAMKHAVTPGVTSRDLNEICGDVFKQHNATSAPRVIYGAPVNAFISVNDAIVHGLPTRRKFQSGDVVKLDVTPFVDGYIVDAAMSVVVPPIPARNQKLIDCAEAAFWSAMKIIRAGQRLNNIGRVIENHAHRHGFNIIRELSGHSVGRSIHEEPEVLNFYNPRDQRVLSEGLVLAVEPMIAAGNPRVFQSSDGWTIKTQGRGLTAHFEHTIVVTKGQPLVLTA